MMVTTSIACPTCSRGTEGTVASRFTAGTAKVTPCQACTDQGITPWRVRQSEVALYLPEVAPVLRHRDGLVTFGR